MNHSSIHAYWNNVQFHSSLVNRVRAQDSSNSPRVVRRDQEHLDSLLNRRGQHLIAYSRLASRDHERGQDNGRVRRKLTRICWKKYGLLLRPNTLSLLLIIMKTMNDQQFASLLTNIQSWLTVQQSWSAVQHHNSNTPAATTMIKNILTVTVVKNILKKRKKLRRRKISKQLLDKIGACNNHHLQKQKRKTLGYKI